MYYQRSRPALTAVALRAGREATRAPIEDFIIMAILLAFFEA